MDGLADLSVDGGGPGDVGAHRDGDYAGADRDSKVALPRKYVLYGMILFSFPAVVMNIGADIQSMGAVAHLLFPAIPTFLFCIVFTGVLLLVIIQYFPTSGWRGC